MHMGRYQRNRAGDGARARMALRSGATSASLLGIASVFALAQGAAAQSVAIPLNYALNTGNNFGAPISNPVLILTINVGVNGGAAQSYAFDTGSASFLTPNGLFTGARVLASDVDIEAYGIGSSLSTFKGDVYQISASSLKFYAAPGATSGGISLGTSGNYNVGSYTKLNDNPPPPNPFGSSVVGAFGAEPEAIDIKKNGSTVTTIGSIFGQTILPNTTPGYVVSANGQSLAALNMQLGTSMPGGPVTGAPQAVQTVPQSVTSCNPCVTVGLTPALLAQFLPLNTVTSTPTVPPFPNSNVQSYNKFVPLNFTLSAPPGSAAPLPSQTVSLDTGFADFHLNTNGMTFPTNPVLTIAAHSGGTQETFNVINTTTVHPSPYTLTASTSVDTFLGIGFFAYNSVLYDLAGQQEGYSPNFVTDANVVTTAASPLVIGADSVPLGLAGVISGTGGVSITGGGSATLSGTNTYTGPTSISGGYLAVVGPGSIATSLGVNVSAGGMFDISGTNNGASIRSLAGDQSGIVWVGSQTLTITAAQDAFAGTIAGSGGLTLTGGAEALTGMSLYTGPTTVSGGTLTVTGDISSSSGVTVNSGAMLNGTGIVPSVTVNDGGILAPGLSPSQITINGNLGMASAAIYLIQVSPTTASKANVSGSANIGGTVDVVATGGNYTLGSKYTILITTSGPVTGTFSGVSVVGGSFGANLRPTLSYDANDVYLTLAQALLPAVPNLSINQQNVSGALNAFINAGGTLPAGFQNLYNLAPSQLAQALTQLEGQNNAGGGQQAAFQLMNEYLLLMVNPFDSDRAGFGGAGFGAGAGQFAPEQDRDLSPDAAAAYAAVTPYYKAPIAPAPKRWNVWAAAFGGSNNTNGDPNGIGSVNFTARTGAVAAGVDYKLTPDTLVGVSLAGGGTSWGLAQGLGSGHSDTFLAGLYGSQRFGAWYLSGAASFANYWMGTSRNITLPAIDTLNANFNAQSWGGRVEGGYRFAWGVINLAPYAAFQAQSFSTPNYSEASGSGTNQFALSYASRTGNVERGELGSWLNTLYVLQGNSVVSLFGRAAWAHDWQNTSQASATFLGLSPIAAFIVNGAKPAADLGVVTAGAELRLASGWGLMGKFDGEFGSGTQTYAGTARVHYVW
jgi:autotransporter-associated beta strand protein